MKDAKFTPPLILDRDPKESYAVISMDLLTALTLVLKGLSYIEQGRFTALCVGAHSIALDEHKHYAYQLFKFEEHLNIETDVDESLRKFHMDHSKAELH